MEDKKRNNASWCCDQIEEKITKWKQDIIDSENINHYEDSDMEFGRRQGMREIISDIEDILYS